MICEKTLKVAFKDTNSKYGLSNVVQIIIRNLIIGNEIKRKYLFVYAFALTAAITINI